MISPLAYVDPSAKIGKNVTIHPFAFIDKNVVIGDDNVIMPNASIMAGARIGNGNRIFNGAVIAAEPQDFDYTGEETVARIGNNNVIRENAVIIRATHAGGETVVGDGNFIMQGVRLSHDVKVGNNCIIGNGSQISWLRRCRRLCNALFECVDAGKDSSGNVFHRIGWNELPKGYSSLLCRVTRTGRYLPEHKLCGDGASQLLGYCHEALGSCISFVV